MSRIGKKIAAFIAACKDILKAFFGIKEKDGAEESGKKVASTVIRRIIYGVADYWLAIFCAAANIALKVSGISLGYAFIAMWAINIVIAGTFLAIYVKTGHDISLGADLRRGVDAIHEKSRIVGYFSMAVVIFQAAVWSGPEQIVIFFKKEIGSTFGMVAVMLFLTAIQTIVWMALYRSGYDLMVG